MTPGALIPSSTPTDELRSQINRRGGDRTPRWLVADAETRCFDEDALQAISVWCLAHLSSEKPYGGICVIPAADRVEIRGRAYDNATVAYQQAGALRTRLAKQLVAGAAVQVEAYESLDPSLWNMHVKRRLSNSYMTAGRVYERAGTCAEQWKLTPRFQG